MDISKTWMSILKLSLILIMEVMNSFRWIYSPLCDLISFGVVYLNSLRSKHLYISVEVMYDCEFEWCRKSLAKYLAYIFIFYFTVLVFSSYLRFKIITFEPFESFCSLISSDY